MFVDTIVRWECLGQGGDKWRNGADDGRNNVTPAQLINVERHSGLATVSTQDAIRARAPALVVL